MKIAFLVLVTGLAAAIAAGTAHAQVLQPEPRAGRPYRGIFGSTAVDADEELTVSGTAGTGYDSNILLETTQGGIGSGSPDPRVSPSGTYALFAGNINYSRSGRNASFAASGSSSTRFHPEVEEHFTSSYGGGAGAAWSPSTRTRMSTTASVMYQPFSLYTLFPELSQLPPGTVFVTDLDYNTLRQSYFNYNVGGDISRQLSRRAAISGNYSYQRSDYSRLYSDFSTHNASIRFTRTISQGFGVRVGYGYSQAVYATSGQRDVGRHYIDTGVDYSKTLSFSRRTSFSFSTGGTATRDSGTTHFDVIGGARLNHEVGRTWNFYAAYNRDVGFVETFAAPFFSDAVNIGLTGLVSRRLQFHSGAGAMFGNIGFDSVAPGADNSFDTTYGTAGLTLALNRFLSVGADYTFYRYSFDQNPLLPVGFYSDENRHSIRATLNAWKPLIQRGRRP